MSQPPYGYPGYPPQQPGAYPTQPYPQQQPYGVPQQPHAYPQQPYGQPPTGYPPQQPPVGAYPVGAQPYPQQPYPTAQSPYGQPAAPYGAAPQGYPPQPYGQPAPYGAAPVGAQGYPPQQPGAYPVGAAPQGYPPQPYGAAPGAVPYGQPPVGTAAPYGTALATPPAPGMTGMTSFNPSRDVEELHRAMKGFGTDERALITVLAHREPEQRVAIAEEFQRVHRKALTAALSSETSGNFRKLLLGLVVPPAELKADYLYDAMAGLGTKDHPLIDVLCQSTNAELQAIKTVYQRKHSGQKPSKKHAQKTGTALEDDVRDETSGNFEKILLATLRCQRDENPMVDESMAQTDAETLYRAGEKRWGTDDATFVSIMTSRSVNHLLAVDKYYRQRHGRGLQEAIRNETSGDYRDALIALTQPKTTYLAYRLHEALAGLGTNDQLLVFILAAHPKRILQEVAKMYQGIYGHSLEHDIRGDTSGDYKNLLLELLK